MRAAIVACLVAATGFLVWLWWLPTLLAFMVAAGLYVCLDWHRIEQVADCHLTKWEITDAAKRYGGRL